MRLLVRELCSFLEDLQQHNAEFTSPKLVFEALHTTQGSLCFEGIEGEIAATVSRMCAGGSWHPDGWFEKTRSMDFAGGTTVHILRDNSCSNLCLLCLRNTGRFLGCMQRFKHIVRGS